MPTLLDNLIAQLDEADAASTLAARVGGDRADVEAAMGPALARVVDGLAELANDRHGTLVVGSLVDQHPGHRGSTATAELRRLVAEGEAGSGNVILDRVFGAERGLVVIGLASGLGLAPSLVGRLLPLLAPLVTAELAVRRRRGSLDDGQVAQLLVADRDEIEAAGTLTGTSFADSGLGATRPTARSTSSRRRAARRGATPPRASLATMEATQALPVIVPTDRADESGPTRHDSEDHEESPSSPSAEATSEIDGLTVAPAIDVPSVDHESADDAAPGPEMLVEPEPLVADRPEPGPVTDTDLDAVTDRAADFDETVIIDGTAAAGAVDEAGVGVERVEDAAEAWFAEMAPVVSPPVVVTVDEPVATPQADPKGMALAWLGWAVGSVVLVLLLAMLLSTCAGGRATAVEVPTVLGLGPSDDDVAATPATIGPAAPTTVTAGEIARTGPTGEQLVPAPDVAASVAATLLGTGIDGVAEGGHVVLTGTVADEAARVDLESRIGTLLGVESIDNRITIVPPLVDPVTDGLVAPGADPDPIDTPNHPVGSTLNEALDLAPVSFATKSAELTDEGRAIVDRVARYLHRHPELLISIDGHTDTDGDAEANLELSQQRADAVLARLLELSVEPERVAAIGHGEAFPALPNDSAENKAANRRIEFTIR